MRKDFYLAVVLLFVLTVTVTNSIGLVPSSLQQTIQSDQQEQPPSHGPFGGKKKCYNKGKEANCECVRECFNGLPGKDAKCKNYCYEDQCACATKCQS